MTPVLHTGDTQMQDAGFHDTSATNLDVNTKRLFGISMFPFVLLTVMFRFWAFLGENKNAAGFFAQNLQFYGFVMTAR